MLAAGAAAGRGDVDRSSSVGWGSSFAIFVLIFIVIFTSIWMYMSFRGR